MPSTAAAAAATQVRPHALRPGLLARRQLLFNASRK
jgi:hypothetical protein